MRLVSMYWPVPPFASRLYSANATAIVENIAAIPSASPVGGNSGS